MKLQQIVPALFALASVASATVMHVVSVGKDGKLAFCPESITAVPGDIVQFQFYPKNHSVVQGFFAKGCTPIADAPAGVAQPGVFSGFMPVSNTSAQGTIPTFSIVVNGTGPLWYYCSQAKHCQSGMTFAINPTAEKSVAGFKANCANATLNITPGQSVPAPAAPVESAPAAPPPAASSEAAAEPPAASATDVSVPTAAATSAAVQTSLPINSLASSTISRTAGWVVIGLAGVMSMAMLL